MTEPDGGRVCVGRGTCGGGGGGGGAAAAERLRHLRSLRGSQEA